MPNDATVIFFNARTYHPMMTATNPIKRGLLLALFVLAVQSADAVPLFARQTGHNCLACHAGGQYPELSPYGRYFKLTGYTLGTRQPIPVAFSLVAGQAGIKNNKNDDGTLVNQQNHRFEFDNASVYLGGKILDNVGLFGQWTYQSAAQPKNVLSGATIADQGHFGADNIDLRYADHYVGDDTRPVKDLIWGVSLNNNPTVTDVWNTVPAWGYPYMGPVQNRGNTQGPQYVTRLEGFGGGSATGLGGYAFLNKNFYAELMGYRTSKGATSWLSYGTKDTDPNNPRLYLKGTNPYLRLAYQSDEHGAHNWMTGAFAMNTAQYGYTQLDFSNAFTWGAANLGGGTTRYQDRGVDAQYQYLTNSHAVTAQARYIREEITDGTATYNNARNNLQSFFAKTSYVYNAKYGASLGYQSVHGSSDANVYIGSPDTIAWTPSIYWQALQNIRLTLQYVAYTQYLGGGTIGTRSASDNNNTWLYLWMAM